MIPYKRAGNNAGIRAYELALNGITLEYKDGSTYSYTFRKPGRLHVKNMKRLAKQGKGLTTYVNKYVRENYDERLK